MTGAAPEFARRTAEAGGRAVGYWEAGAGDPLLVLPAAGGPATGPALRLLAAGFRVVVAELTEPEDTERGNGGPGLDGLATAAAALAGAAGLDRFHLLGASLGGAVALHLALRDPGRVRSLVLTAPAQFRSGARPPLSIPPAERAAALRAHPEREPALAAPDPDALARSWPLAAPALAGVPEYDEQVAARMERCPVRTLVLFGTRDGVIPPENGRVYRRLMPACTLQYVYDAAHDLAADRPEAFADVTGDFLRRGLHFLIPEAAPPINP
jgi:pimeloyl-ACP methyl ester carboxylesterase